MESHRKLLLFSEALWLLLAVIPAAAIFVAFSGWVALPDLMRSVLLAFSVPLWLRVALFIRQIPLFSKRMVRISFFMFSLFTLSLVIPWFYNLQEFIQNEDLLTLADPDLTSGLVSDTYRIVETFCKTTIFLQIAFFVLVPLAIFRSLFYTFGGFRKKWKEETTHL